MSDYERHRAALHTTFVRAKAQGRRPLLLHACCGPCTLEPLRALRDEGFDPVICWTNPNIAPQAEHDLRRDTLLHWAHDEDILVLEAKCDHALWESRCASLADDRCARCRACYALRLEKTCCIAKDLGFEYVATTLAVSPYQLFDICSEELEFSAKAYGLTPVIRDFRDLYRAAVKRSRELAMYRQNYCGCRFSVAEAEASRKAMRDLRARRRRQDQTGKYGQICTEEKRKHEN